MGDRNKRDNKHVIMIEAYEKILFNNRKKERVRAMHCITLDHGK